MSLMPLPVIGGIGGGLVFAQGLMMTPLLRKLERLSDNKKREM
jgi:hypothetical protein